MGAKLGGDAKLQELLSKSVFLISIGSQDLNPRWNPQPDDQPQGSVIRELAELYVDAVRSLYDMGARKLAIVNTGHIGCMPKRRNYVCDQSLNEITAEFSQALPSFIPSVSSEKAGFSDSIGDFYGFETDIFADPTAFGPTCYMTDDYWFWDTEFITEHAAKLTAAAFYYGPSYYTEPITFKALLEKK
uniref:GDSL esterase/lipase n=1 Tax=Aegilops tauschii TaxID=37682 RepID=N1QPK4_AEGTA